MKSRPVPGTGSSTASPRIPADSRAIQTDDSGTAKALAAEPVSVNAVDLARALDPWTTRRRTDLPCARTGTAAGPSADPEFGVRLIVDRSPTMTVWRDTVSTLIAVLEQADAFSTVEVHDLAFGADDAPQFRTAPAPGCRELVILVSDCEAAPPFSCRRPDGPRRAAAVPVTPRATWGTTSRASCGVRPQRPPTSPCSARQSDHRCRCP